MKRKTVVVVEKILTNLSVVMLCIFGLLAVLAVFDGIFEWDMLSDDGKMALGIFSALLCIFIFLAVMISAILKVSRIADHIESIVEQRKEDSKNIAKIMEQLAKQNNQDVTNSEQ